MLLRAVAIRNKQRPHWAEATASPGLGGQNDANPSVLWASSHTGGGSAGQRAPAQAQAARTWVSGVGDDANPCSRTAPCKTFAGAISKTAAAGIIDCLDPGGFGTITITKSITIDCGAFTGGILSSGTNGVNVNGAGIVVTLRNLTIEGAGTGLIGINFINGAALNVENCNITQFQAGSATGIKFAPPNGVTAELFVRDTTVTENGTASTGGGIIVQPTGTGVARATLTRVSLVDNLLGVRADGTGSTGGITVAVSDSTMSGNTFSGATSFTPVGGAVTRVMISSSTISSNGNGVNANGASAILRIGGSILTDNASSVKSQNGATMTSFGTNQINDNGDVVAIPVVGPS